MTDILHVGNISAKTTGQHLHDLFAQVGPVVSARVMMDDNTQTSRGFALVEMSTPEASADAMKAVNRLLVDGRVLSVRVLPPRAVGWGSGNDQGGSNRSHGLGMGNGGSRW